MQQAEDERTAARPAASTESLDRRRRMGCQGLRWRSALGLGSLLLVLLSLAATTQPVAGQPGAPRVLIVGDSWSEFMWVNRSLRRAFADNGRPDLLEKGNRTAISGSEAADWVEPEQLALIADELARNPSIEVVQLTVGGNDMLSGRDGGGWYAGMPAAEREALFQQILTDLTTIVDHILVQRSDLEVLISAYDYLNFVDTFSSFLFLVCIEQWDDLGRPSPGQLNRALIALEDRMEAFAASRPRVHMVRHNGLMQFVFGFPDRGIAPGQLLPPGDLELPSPIDAMLLDADCIHLGSTGYAAIAENLWQGFYADHFAAGGGGDDGGDGGGGDGGASCQWPVGHGRFCSECGPCAAGEGDCDRDSECLAGLTCVDDVGAQFGFNANVDVCLAQGGGGDGGGGGSCQFSPGHGRFCSECGPCATGQGDCDRDSECSPGLSCAQNVGAQFGYPANVDVCVGSGSGGSCPWPAGHGRFCSECGPCAAGQGDCDNDLECAPGLVCADNVGAQFGFNPNVDVCVQP